MANFVYAPAVVEPPVGLMPAYLAQPQTRPGLFLGYSPDYSQAARISRPNIVGGLHFGQFSRPGNAVVVFDNKGKPEHPRLGIVFNDGTVFLVEHGTSPILQANDLESISLIDANQRIYAASDSLGMTYIFRFLLSQGGRDIEVQHISQFQLQVPGGEGLHHADWNRTNIETMRVHHDPELGTAITWAGRGGSDYAGRMSTGEVWIRTARFDLTYFQPDYSTMKEGKVRNVTGDLSWREISDIDIVGSVAIFATAVDREEANPLKPGETRDSVMAQGRNLFDSQIVATDLTSGRSTVLAMLPNLKVEAVMADGTGRVWVGTDDEGLGSLIGEITTGEFIDVAAIASHSYSFPLSAWGISGIAPGPFDSFAPYAAVAHKYRTEGARGHRHRSVLNRGGASGGARPSSRSSSQGAGARGRFSRSRSAGPSRPPTARAKGFPFEAFAGNGMNAYAPRAVPSASPVYSTGSGSPYAGSPTWGVTHHAPTYAVATPQYAATPTYAVAPTYAASPIMASPAVVAPTAWYSSVC